MTYRTRAQIEKTFNVDSRGIIRSPGKYETQPVWAPYFDALALEGDGDARYPQCQHGMALDQLFNTDDCDCQAWEYFYVDSADREQFAPYLDDVTNVWLWTDSQGFIIALTNTDESTIRRTYFGIVD